MSLTTHLKDKFQNAIHQEKKLLEKDPFSGDYSTIIMETRAFTVSPPDAKRCSIVITKILHLLATGFIFSEKEANELFFGVTRLFQSKNFKLRRLLYLLLKKLTIDENAFIVVSSLTKDMNESNELYRANSIRVLSSIVDATVAQQMERYFKNAIVDRVPIVASSALVCGLSLIKSFPDIVRRWTNEVSQCLHSPFPMVQYHGFLLSIEMKAKDKVALHKLFLYMVEPETTERSVMAECALIRLGKWLLLNDRHSVVEKGTLTLLYNGLKHKSEMVTLEAAKSFVEIIPFKNQFKTLIDMNPAVCALQIFLASPKPILRFAAVRAINSLSQYDPALVQRCSHDLEALLSDNTKSIGTFALVTLLKVCEESVVERLLKDTQTLLKDSGDAYRVEIIHAVRLLCETYPSKHNFLMEFLSRNLQKEASMEVKTQIVNTLVYLCDAGERESAFYFLCEFIEDCEYPPLSCKVLSFLSTRIAKSDNPSKFIRYIYNRLLLEHATVRAEAVTCLSKIAAVCPSMCDDIRRLIESRARDTDDEVRERSLMYLNAFQKQKRKAQTTLEDEDKEDKEKEDKEKQKEDDDETVCSISELTRTNLDFNLEAFTANLKVTLENPDIIFNYDNVPTDVQYEQIRNVKQTATQKPTTPIVESSQFAVIQDIISLSEIGELHHTVSNIALTESESEYRVVCCKHIFSKHVVVELQTTNTMPNQTLEECGALVSPTANWKVLDSTKISSLTAGDTQSLYVVVQKLEGEFSKGEFSLTLTFTVKEDSNDLVGYKDEYPVEPFVIGGGDFICPKPLRPTEFKMVWEGLANTGHEKISRFFLKFNSVQTAVTGLLKIINASPCEGSESCLDKANSHVLFLSGSLVDEAPVLLRLQIVYTPEHGCIMKSCARSNSEFSCDEVLRAIS